MEDGWDTPPFESSERNGKIYSRGVSNDKGQMVGHLKAFESYLKTGGRVPVNLKFLLDGEEEMMGFGLDNDGFHGGIERWSIEMFHRGVETAIVYLEDLARLPQGIGAAAAARA